MGYSHYHPRVKELPADKFKAASADCRKVVEVLVREHPDCRVQYETDDPRPPVFDDDLIRFNGPGTAGYETFLVARVYNAATWDKPRGGKYFAFCKTDNRPYDIAVCCCLIVLAYHLGEDIQVGSDGDDKDWKPSRDLCQRVLGYGDDFTLGK